MVVGVRVVEIELDSLLILGNGLIDAPFAGQRVSQIAARFRKVGH